MEKDVSAVAAWDSSVHDSVHLNRVTDSKAYKYTWGSLCFSNTLKKYNICHDEMN